MDIWAADGEGVLEGGPVDRGTPATSVEGRDTGLWTAGDEVTPLRSYKTTDRR